MPDPVPAATPDPLKAARREARELRSHLRELAATVTAFLAHLDQAMEGPSTPDRGRGIAALAGQLEMANDSAKHFGLGIDFDDPAFRDPRKPARRRKAEGVKP